MLDQCGYLLSTTSTPPEVFERSAWRDRDHLSVARAGRVLTLERDERIRTPVELFSIAVPAYRELYNGNLERLLGQIYRQDVAPGRVQVIVMVNNSIQTALNADDPTLIENKRTVEWLRQLRARLPFRLEVIDETRGIDRVMGTLRNRALDLAMAITDVDPRRHVMINLDADVTIAPDYLRRLDAYYGHFDVDAVITRRGHTLPTTVDPVHFQLMGLSEFGHINHDMQNVADFPFRGYVTPQITARASAVRELGGFGYIDFEEDFDFGKRLGALTLAMAPDVYVAQSDRARADGFAAAKRARIINNAARSLGKIDRGLPKTASLETYAGAALAPLYAHLAQQVYLRRVSGYGALVEFERQARRCFLGLPGRPPTLQSPLPQDRPPCDLNQFTFFAGRARSAESSQSLDVGSYLMGAVSSGLRGAELSRFNDRLTYRRFFERRLIARRLRTIRQIINGDEPAPTGQSDIFDDHVRDPKSALRRDIDRQVHQRRQESANHDQWPTSPDTLLERVIERYPDFLDESLSDPWVVQNQSLRFLNDWFLRARARPEDYPGTMDFLSLRPVR